MPGRVFAPQHDLTLGRMEQAAVRRVIDVWAEQTAELGAEYRWVQVFENRGEAMGASNPHPHGQIWAGTALPGAGEREDASQRSYLSLNGRRMLLDYVDHETGGQRAVVETDEWLAVVPFWAAWPFETLVMPKRPAARLTDLDDAARDDLAVVLHELLGRYDGLFKRPFPYSMGWHQAPFGDESDGSLAGPCTLLPPLLRGQRAQVHGRVRVARGDAAGPDSRGRGRAVAGGRAAGGRGARRGSFLNNAPGSIAPSARTETRCGPGAVDSAATRTSASPRSRVRSRSTPPSPRTTSPGRSRTSMGWAAPAS